MTESSEGMNRPERSSCDLETKNLTYHPSGAKEPILSDVSYTFARGHMTALLGPNGSGKTTMLRHFLAQIRSPEGAVLIDGRDTHDFSPKERSRRIAWVPQSSSGDSAFEVEDVVLMARYPFKGMWDGDSEEDRRIAEEAMKTVGVYQFRKRDFSSLSGGERQRVLIARALAQTTPWILLDEPTSNLDIKHQIQTLQMLKDGVDAGKMSAIVVMHDFNMVEKYCDRAIILRDGKVVAKGSVSEVLVPEIMREVYEVEFDVVEKGGRRLFVPRNGIT